MIVATRELRKRKELQKDALAASQHATTVMRTANYLDTLACVYAFIGDFK